MSKENLQVLDLFCGAGGLSYGFEKAGYKIVLGIDNDKAALKTFELNHNESKGLNADISTINVERIKPYFLDNRIDVVIGGPPCQGMSLSGHRKFDDPRNKLYLSYIRIVEELKPKAFLIENVPGLVSLFEGKIKNNVIERLSNIGYNVTYKILLASDYGVPQSRKRVFFVGLKNGIFNFDKILKSDTIITSEMALNDLPSLEFSLGEEGMSYDSAPKNNYQRLMRENSDKIYNHIGTNHTKKVKDIISLVPDGGNYKDLPKELQETRKFNVAWTRYNSKKPAPTVDTGHRHHFHYKYNRVPTVRESARLQSFPDDFVFLGNKTEQYRQVGNAVPPLLAEYIAKNLIKYL